MTRMTPLLKRNEQFASGAVVLIAVIIVVIMLGKRDK